MPATLLSVTFILAIIYERERAVYIAVEYNLLAQLCEKCYFSCISFWAMFLYENVGLDSELIDRVVVT